MLPHYMSCIGGLGWINRNNLSLLKVLFFFIINMLRGRNFKITPTFFMLERILTPTFLAIYQTLKPFRTGIEKDFALVKENRYRL